MVDPGLPNDDVANRLIDSARALLEEDGLDHVTVRSVAIGAGVSTMNVYSRFGGKDGLLDVLYREGFEELRDRLTAIEADHVGDHLREVTAEYRRFAEDHPARYELMFDGEGRGFRPSDESADLARGLLATIAHRIDAAVSNRQISLPPDTEPIAVAATLWAMCHGTLSFRSGGVADSILDWEGVAAGGVDALIERYCRAPVN